MYETIAVIVKVSGRDFPISDTKTLEQFYQVLAKWWKYEGQIFTEQEGAAMLQELEQVAQGKVLEYGYQGRYACGLCPQWYPCPGCNKVNGIG